MITSLSVMRFEINAICAVILIYILLRSRADGGRQSKNRAFRRLMLALICILGLDACWALIDGISGSPFLSTLNFLINAVYLTNSGVITFLWYFYVETQLESERRRRARGTLLLVLPLLLLGILCVSSQWTHLIFYIDEKNVYQQGPALFLQVLIAYGYLAAATVKIVRRLSYERRRQSRRELNTLLLFVLFPAIGGLCELIFWEIPTTWPLSALSAMIIYINFQSYQISTDELTGLNNRRRFDNYITDAVMELRKNEKLHLLLIDVDRFKQINDTFGHPEGDRALQMVSKMLKNVCHAHSVFAARYGGDEFAVVCTGMTDTGAENLKQMIQLRCAKLNKNPAKQYDISLSIGIGICEYHRGRSVSQFIAAADRELYREKAAGKSHLRAAGER